MTPNPKTQVSIYLRYDFLPQEKTSLLQALAERFAIDKVDEVPVNDAHECILSFVLLETAPNALSVLAFLEQLQQAGVIALYERLAMDAEERATSASDDSSPA